MSSLAFPMPTLKLLWIELPFNFVNEMGEYNERGNIFDMQTYVREIACLLRYSEGKQSDQSVGDAPRLQSSKRPVVILYTLPNVRRLN